MITTHGERQIIAPEQQPAAPNAGIEQHENDKKYRTQHLTWECKWLFVIKKQSAQQKVGPKLQPLRKGLLYMSAEKPARSGRKERR